VTSLFFFTPQTVLVDILAASSISVINFVTVIYIVLLAYFLRIDYFTVLCISTAQCVLTYACNGHQFGRSSCFSLSLPTAGQPAVLCSTRVSSAGEPAIGINAMDKSVYLFTESERVKVV